MSSPHITDPIVVTIVPFLCIRRGQRVTYMSPGEVDLYRQRIERNPNHYAQSDDLVLTEADLDEIERVRDTAIKEINR